MSCQIYNLAQKCPGWSSTNFRNRCDQRRSQHRRRLHLAESRLRRPSSLPALSGGQLALKTIQNPTSKNPPEKLHKIERILSFFSFGCNHGSPLIMSPLRPTSRTLTCYKQEQKRFRDPTSAGKPSNTDVALPNKDSLLNMTLFRGLFACISQIHRQASTRIPTWLS